MKIAIIHGQTHKGSTYHLSRLLLEHLKEPEVTEFFLPRDLNHFCIGCYKCLENEVNCPYYGKKQPILEAVEAADLLIFTTPCYCLLPSAPMRAFMDLTFTYWMSHRPRSCMFTKKAVVLSTAAGIGARKAAKGVADMLFYWGVPCIKTYGIAVQAMNWQGVSEQKKAKLAKAMAKLAKELTCREKPAVGLKTRGLFYVMRMMQKAGWGAGPADQQYWADQGWLERARPWQKENGPS